MGKYTLLILEGALTTIEIALAALLLAILFGAIYAVLRFSRVAFFEKVASGYVAVVRGVPSLVMMYLVYYGIQKILNESLVVLGVDQVFIIDSFVAGVFTLAFIYGSYMGETFRSAVLAMDKGSIEVAESLGFNKWQLFVRIKVPQIIRHGFASFENNWLVLLKDTSIISIIGINDLVYLGKNIGTTTRQPFTILFVISLIYLFFNTVSTLGLRYGRSKYHLD